MEPRIDIITLAVADLERALDFYRDGLGLESRGVIATEFVGDDVEPAGAIAMFKLRGGLILSIYPRTELAKDAKVPLGPPKTGEFSLDWRRPHKRLALVLDVGKRVKPVITPDDPQRVVAVLRSHGVDLAER